jgi:hypothetical protein
VEEQEEEETRAVMSLTSHLLAGWRRGLIHRDTFKCFIEIPPNVTQCYTAAHLVRWTQVPKKGFLPGYRDAV